MTKEFNHVATASPAPAPWPAPLPSTEHLRAVSHDKHLHVDCTYLFGPEPVHLNELYWRPGDSTQQFWTLPYVPGKRYVGKPVSVLTSPRTFSGAEEFSYNLKNLKRATLVGETTGGGAHPGGPERVNDHFAVWLPTGRAINPISKTNWEGTGVKPDVEVPADQALATAHLAALRKLQEGRSGDDAAEIRRAIEAVQKQVDALSQKRASR
jgi:retinol-binding protein 3